jgi:hypothetical protein
MLRQANLPPVAIRYEMSKLGLNDSGTETLERPVPLLVKP